ncbi:hypothetical protein M3Y99_00735900 [Aphelenchoides fujianensis]|nr:hypothetical protein M3Y99_00735900 [Aphelenchoides fujianensis]
MSSAAMEKLQTFDWYVGFVPKKHLQKFFRSAGDWCVRGSCAKGDVELMICALGEDHELHDFLIRERPSKSGRVGWSLRKEATSPPFFRELPDLVRYLREDAAAKVCLKDPIQRPKIFLKAGVLQCAAVTLGQGQYGKVVRGVYEKYGKQCDVAVKIPKHPDVRGFCSPHSDKLLRELHQQVDQMIWEGSLLFSFHHPNIVRCLGLDFNEPSVKLVLTLAPGGSLLEHLRRYRDGIRYEEKVIFLLEAARGYKFVHEAKVLHRDISARNLLIGRHGQVLVSDFGLALPLEEAWEDEKELQIPIAWLAPECLRRTARYSRKSDVFAFAVLMYEVLHDGAQPWPEIGDLDEIIRLVRAGRRMTLTARVPAPMRDLLAVCWAQHAYLRPEFHEITRRLREIADRLKEPGVAIRPFFLDDPADFEVGELSPPPSTRELAKLDKRLSAEASKEDARRKTRGTPDSVEATPTKAPTMVAPASSSTTNRNSSESTRRRSHKGGKAEDSLTLKRPAKLVPSPLHNKKRGSVATKAARTESRPTRKQPSAAELSTTARRRTCRPK